MKRSRLISRDALWPHVILCHAMMVFLSLEPKATMWIATSLQQRAILKVADFCLQGPCCIVKTSSIDAWIVAVQHKTILLSGSDEGNCVTAHHASEGWHFRGDIGKIFLHVRTIVYFLCPNADRQGTNTLGSASLLCYLGNWAFFACIEKKVQTSVVLQLYGVSTPWK